MALLPHGPLWTFLAGFCGSAAVEIVAMDEIFHRSVKLPARYYSVLFWFIRFFVACAGGALAVGYNIENLIAAAQIGASGPVIIKSLARVREH